MLSKESLWRNILQIKYVHQRNRILAERSSKNYNFVVFANFVYEFTAVRSNIYKYIVESAFNFYGKYNVSLISLTEGRVHKSFIYIKNECLAATKCFSLWAQ